MTLAADLERNNRIRALIDELLAQPRLLGPDYQPVVRLDDGAVVGYKATGRGQPGTELGDTLSLLVGAQSLGLVERLDWAFRALAFEDVLARPEFELHLTPEPETFGAMCPPRFAALFLRARRELRVVAEVHATTLTDSARLRTGLAELREWGWRVAVADVADDDTAARMLATVRPDLVQLDFALPGRVAGTPSPAVARFIAAAGEQGAELMGVNVDTAAAKAAARELGCAIGRGLAFGAPGSLPPA